MKKYAYAVVIILAVRASGRFVCAQGPLTPPGAPAPTMKSLDQIEARTPITSAPFFINASGSYYLTKNLSVTSGDAITINVGNVSLDLNGFTISSTKSPAGGTAIYAPNAVKNVSIKNGLISSGVTLSGGSYSGTGFGYGIYLPAAVSARVSDVSVTGVTNHGIYIGLSSSVAESCTVDTAGGYGITAMSISRCTVMNGFNSIYGNTVADSYAGSSLLYGIQADTVSNSYGSSTGFNTPGILAVTAINSWGAGTSDCGVRASNIQNCYGTTTGSSSGGGVYGVTVNNSRGDSSGSCVGLRADQLASNSYGFNSSTGSGLVAGNAEHCSGIANGAGFGISADVATACTGQSKSSGKGIGAFVVNGCKGESSSGYGITADLVTASYGKSVSSRGIYTDGVVTNSRGVSSSAEGIWTPVSGIAAFSYGSSNTGVAIGATIAIGCSGANSSSSTTLAVPNTIFCSGQNYGTGKTIDANTAFECDTAGTLTAATHRYFCDSGAAVFP